MSQQIKHQPSCADDYDPMSITVDEARNRIIDDIEPITGKVKRPLRDCLNHVLAQDVHSPIDVPSHTNSAMDGYAITSTNLPGPGEVKNYAIIGTAFAGTPFTDHCKEHQAVRIMTGAVIPADCDVVVMQEKTEIANDGTVRIGEGHRSGQNIRQAGEDIARGAKVLATGRLITPADLGILASLGVGELSVYRRPRVAFFSTGDELRSVGDTLKQGEIYDSNRYTLFGMLKRFNADILDMGVVRDDPDAMRKAFSEAAKMADVIITSGGVSVGEADHIKTILGELGDIRFWKIAMKPGRPLTFGKIGNARFFGLPGNPVAVMVTFYQFVQPALHYLASGKKNFPVSIKARCESPLRKRSGRYEFQRGIYEQADNGELIVKKTGQQGSGILTSMSIANCFILLPEDATNVEVGDEVLIQPFGGFV